MKRVVLILLVCLMVISAVASPVGKEQAMQAAAEFMALHVPSHRATNLAKPRLVESHEKAYYYVFDMGSAYVVASGDDRTPSVLGYSLSGGAAQGEMPRNMRAFLESYANQLAYADSHAIAVLPTVRRAQDLPSISPLLKTNWDQSAPYNNSCPKDSETGNRSATGCLATAMAQVLCYHQHPAKTLATIPAYTTATLKMRVAAIQPTDISWADMLPTYKDATSGTSKQRSAVATLMQLCGASVEMDYTETGSGAYEAELYDAFTKYFGYDKSAQLVYRDHLTSAQWNQKVYSELENRRPVLFTGGSSGGGHAFVIDGYDKDGYFHVNWGWGGWYDGNFLLDILNPLTNDMMGASTSPDGYSYGQSIFVGAKPDEGGSAPAPRMTVSSIQADGSSRLIRRADGTFAVGVKSAIYNMTGQTVQFDLGLGLYDNDGNLLEQKIDYTTKLEPNRGYSEYRYDPFVCGKGLADGTYWIRTLSAPAGQTLQSDEGADYQAMKVIIKGQVMTLVEKTISLTGQLVVDGTAKSNEVFYVTATVSNQGSDFSDDVYLFIGEELVGGQHLEVDEEGSATLTFPVKTQQTGRQYLALYYYQGNSSVNIAYVTIDLSSGDVSQETVSLKTLFSVANATDGVLAENQADVELAVTNTGSVAYDANVIVALYKLVDNSLTIADQKSLNLSLAAGAKKTLSCRFTGLADQQTYYLVLWYSDGMNTVYSDDDTARFDTSFAPVATSVLSAAFTLHGVNNGMLAATSLTGQVELTNDGEEQFNDNVSLRLLYQHKTTHRWYVVQDTNSECALHLAPGGKTVLDFNFQSLEEGTTYSVSVLYSKTPSEKDALRSDAFVVTLPSAIGHIYNGQGQVDVYGVDGRRSGHSSRLSHGLYIVNGKKVMKR